jgi:hypothetical protein
MTLFLNEDRRKTTFGKTSHKASWAPAECSLKAWIFNVLSAGRRMSAGGITSMRHEKETRYRWRIHDPLKKSTSSGRQPALI